MAIENVLYNEFGQQFLSYETLTKLPVDIQVDSSFGEFCEMNAPIYVLAFVICQHPCVCRGVRNLWGQQ